MYKRLLIVLAFITTSLWVQAQELNCNVMVSAPTVSGTNKQVFESLKTTIQEFMNTRQWTTQRYAINERIDCSLSLIVSRYESEYMTCEMTIQSRRPVFGSAYTTTMLNHRDRSITFHYSEFEPLEVDATYSNNLVAILAYYAYIIIGYDMDSYSRLGGSQCFQEAANIVSHSQSHSSDTGERDGWEAFDKNLNRYSLTNCLISDRYRAIREYYYTYHRLALDDMARDVIKARARIAEDLKVIRESNKIDPSNAVVTEFVNAKIDELANIFEKGTSEEKATVYDHLSAIAPSSTNILNKLK